VSWTRFRGAGGEGADARQDVQRVEELDGAALEVDWFADLDRVEGEEALQKVGAHPGDERILAHERGHDRARGEHGHALLDQDLLEGARVVVRMRVREDDVGDAARRDAIEPQKVRRVRRWVDQYPTAAHPEDEARCRLALCKSIGRAQDGDAELGRLERGRPD
jgi:hypothetical protein